jgi:hypothetical protein
LGTARGPREAPSSAVREGRQGLEPQKTQMVRADLGLVPTRWLCGALHLRHLRFLFFLLTLGARKGRVALRAECRRQRSSASGPMAAIDGLGAGRDGKQPVGGCGHFFAKFRNNPASAGGGLLPAGPPGVGPRPWGSIDTGRGGFGFCEIPQRPSTGAGSCRRTRSGRVRRPGDRLGERRAQVVADVVLRNRAMTLPQGQAPSAGPAPSGCAAPGGGGARVGGT